MGVMAVVFTRPVGERTVFLRRARWIWVDLEGLLAYALEENEGKTGR